MRTLITFFLCLLPLVSFSQGVAVRSIHGKGTNLNVKGVGGTNALTVEGAASFDSLSTPILYVNQIVLTNTDGSFWTNLTGIFRGITNNGSLVNTGQVTIAPTALSYEHLRINHTNGNQLITLGSYPADPTRGAIWLGNVGAASSTPILWGNIDSTVFNGTSLGVLAIGGNSQWFIEADLLYPNVDNQRNLGKVDKRILGGFFGTVNASGGFKTYAGTLMTNLVSATAALDFGNILAATSADLTITVSGAKANDSVHLGLPTAPDVSIVFNAFVSAANTVTVRAFNVGAIAVDQASATFRVTVHQF